LIVGLDEGFDVVAKERDIAFQDDEARRESESLREKRFFKAERARAVGFAKDQETREKRAEWYAKIRESRFQRGRQEREEMCQKLEKDMQEQLEKLLSTGKRNALHPQKTKGTGLFGEIVSTLA
jgi:hypothetical protein